MRTDPIFARFVTIFSRNLLPQLHLHARIFRLQVVHQTSKLNGTRAPERWYFWDFRHGDESPVKLAENRPDLTLCLSHPVNQARFHFAAQRTFPKPLPQPIR